MNKLLLSSSIMLFLCCTLCFATTDHISPERDPFKQQQEIETLLQTKLIHIHYNKAEEIAALLQNHSDNKIGVNKHLNALWITGKPSDINKAHALIRQLDIPAKQILITARIANVDDNFTQELGLKLDSRTNKEKGKNSNTEDQELNMDLPTITIKPGQFNVAIAKLGNNSLLDLQLSALEMEGRGKVISSPQLLTSNRQTAYIEAGEEIPYQEQAGNGATNTAFKKAVLSLKVTPTITPHNKILLDLVVNQDKMSSIKVNGIPTIQTREVHTQVLVNNGTTIVLGGIYEMLQSNNVERIPILSSLPIAGALFQRKQNRLERRELLIFVTPKVVD